jgi:hypothetical protein
MNWSWSDAWVLMAAHLSKENPVSLSSLFAMGDALNHTLFLDDELEHGLTLLSAAGLAHLDGEVVVLSSDGIRLCEEAIKSTAHVRGAMRKAEEKLQEIDLAGKDLTPVTIPAAAVAAGIKGAHKIAARQMAARNDCGSSGARRAGARTSPNLGAGHPDEGDVSEGRPRG